MPGKSQRNGKHTRPPRIRVPNNERALFSVEEQKLVGVVKRLSLTGGSTVLVKGPLPEGTSAEMVLRTVYGKVTAEVEFLHTGADGNPLAQAFRFVDMDETSCKRFAAAAKQMQHAGFSDVDAPETSLGDRASQSFLKLRENLRRLSGVVSPRRATRAEN